MVTVEELRTQLKGPHVNIGAHTYAAGPIKTYAQWPITIGKYCSLAWGIEFLITGGHHADCVSTYPFDNLDNWPESNDPLYPYHKGLEINIGNDVWIGCNAVIMHNSPIGDGAIIASHAVVTEPVRPYAIVGGNPAREIRRRFPDEIIDKLLEIRWWDWPDEKVRANMNIITHPPDMETLCSIL